MFSSHWGHPDERVIIAGLSTGKEESVLVIGDEVKFLLQVPVGGHGTLPAVAKCFLPAGPEWSAAVLAAVFHFLILLRIVAPSSLA